MTVNAQVAEADVPQLKPGMPVYFTTLGHAERRYQSRIRQILPTPEKVNDVVLFTVLIDIDNRARELMTNMTTQTFLCWAAPRICRWCRCRRCGRWARAASCMARGAHRKRH